MTRALCLFRETRWSSWLLTRQKREVSLCQHKLCIYSSLVNKSDIIAVDLSQSNKCTSPTKCHSAPAVCREPGLPTPPTWEPLRVSWLRLSFFQPRRDLTTPSSAWLKHWRSIRATPLEFSNPTWQNLLSSERACLLFFWGTIVFKTCYIVH